MTNDRKIDIELSATYYWDHFSYILRYIDRHYLPLLQESEIAFLQDFSDEEIEERVLYCYETSMAKFMEDWKDVPKENAVEISYKELSEYPIETIKKIYNSIHLGDFDAIKPVIEAYVSKEKNYKKNSFTEIRSDLLVQINKRWKFALDKYNYKIMDPK